MLTALCISSAKMLHTSLFVDHNRATINGLVETIIIYHVLYFTFLPPYLNAESIGCIVSGPKHEFVFFGAIYCTFSFEPGIIRTGDNQPIIAITMEVQISCLENEFRLACRLCCTLLVLGDESKVGLPF